MAQKMHDALLPAKLQPGDRVVFVSPASTPERADIEQCGQWLHNEFGLVVEYGAHAFDELGFLAGRDQDRLADLNNALRDPGIKAIIATRGGKGAYRLANDLDFAAARKHPKLLIGFSEITILHLALWQHCNLTGIHGAPWGESFGKDSSASFRRAVFTTNPIVVRAKQSESTSALTTTGTATGRLLGGNQDLIATAAGWTLPNLDGAILLLEAVGLRLGHIDRQLTMLTNAGYLKHIKGVAVGQYTDCTPDATTQGHWTAIDVLRDRLHPLGVPILGGLPIGHGDHPIAVPLGTMATLDANAGTLSIAPGVE